mmetsp:Transcript_11401/g.30217  ORF Transcript_11401/g.30217 Transcript_11401/m.30217 type:complete len:195 (-) Transcript_11401:569-1153(-)
MVFSEEEKRRFVSIIDTTRLLFLPSLPLSLQSAVEEGDMRTIPSHLHYRIAAVRELKDEVEKVIGSVQSFYSLLSVSLLFTLHALFLLDTVFRLPHSIFSTPRMLTVLWLLSSHLCLALSLFASRPAVGWTRKKQKQEWKSSATTRTLSSLHLPSPSPFLNSSKASLLHSSCRLLYSSAASSTSASSTREWGPL